MQYEVEQKFVVSDADQIRSALEALGAEFAAPIQQCDRYLAHPSRNFAETDEALRIRMVGDTSFVTYKGPKIDPTMKTRREIELPIGSGAKVPDDFTEFFVALGFRVVAEVRKQRASARVQWQNTTVEAVIDKVDQLGTYAELEICVAESELAAAKVTINDLASHLALTQVERRSYLEMLLEADA